MAENEKGSRKAPRTHQKHWADATNTARTQDRTELDNAWALSVSGGRYPTLRKLMTGIHRGEITLAETQPTLREPDTRLMAGSHPISQQQAIIQIAESYQQVIQERERTIEKLMMKANFNEKRDVKNT
jgi:hypothetical protein